MKKRILHITPHLGGGVGRAISSTLIFEKNTNGEFCHKLLALEKPKNPQFADICSKNEIEIVFSQNLEEIKSEIEKSDLVILHWWHHPLNVWLLANFPKVECRIILWSHINGCSYPKLPFSLIKEVEETFFTSKYTLSNPLWNIEEQNFAQKHSMVVYGLGKFDEIESKIHKKAKVFNIGYVGTINFSKLHPDFVKYCAEVLKVVPTAIFTLVGIPECKAEILSQAKKLNIQDKFNFTGYTKNVNDTLKTFDVFGYPLNPDHFGTTENVVLEAMNVGIPVVMLNQSAEKYLIEDKTSGFLANSVENYAQIMRILFENEALRNQIAQNAKKHLQKEFSIEKNIKNFENGITEALKEGKKVP